jgi:hypothetical protein
MRNLKIKTETVISTLMFNQQDDISGLGHLLAWTLGREKHFEESI